MAPKLQRLLILAGALLAIPATGFAGLTLRNLGGANMTVGGLYSIDLDTDTELFSTSFLQVAGSDFQFSIGAGGVPSTLIGNFTGTHLNFQSNSPILDNLALLGAGVPIGANSTTALPGSDFGQYGYFAAPVPTGRHFIGFQTSADLDRDPFTTGIHYGFFDIEVGSLTVIGYGFGSVPGEDAVTTAIPEPATGALVLLAAGTNFVWRRRRQTR